ncbi:hypothetical protein GCM10010990_32310 [Croceicoccus mobilis]|uniref:Uncharacterized protein n=1 Tax=Croceicoccus mobilis TaxID=1703339 RepID=A0A916Z8E6_9SPHN|nr:hypothetical protein GCM10010990_32310 [Croceicoccus mobilis]
MTRPGMRHDLIALPGSIYPDRRNSAGLDLSDEAVLAELGHSLEETAKKHWLAGKPEHGALLAVNDTLAHGFFHLPAQTIVHGIEEGQDAHGKVTGKPLSGVRFVMLIAGNSARKHARSSRDLPCQSDRWSVPCRAAAAFKRRSLRLIGLGVCHRRSQLLDGLRKRALEFVSPFDRIAADGKAEGVCSGPGRGHGNDKGQQEIRRILLWSETSL